MTERDPSADLVDAVVVALGTDRLASPDDTLPDPDSTDRRGWWGDLDAAEVWQTDAIGARFWLLWRVAITGPRARQGSLIARAETYGREAMADFITNRIGTRVEVTAERTDVEAVDTRVVLYRGPLPAIELRYAQLWGGIRA